MATIALSGPTLLKAGANVSSVMTVDANLEVENFIEQAESAISVLSNKDWIAAYSGLSTNIKLILEEVVSNLAAIYCIQYDMSGYTSRGEAEDMISVLRDAAIRGMSLIKNKNKQDFMDKI